jgi:hypothetical protein
MIKTPGEGGGAALTIGKTGSGKPVQINCEVGSTKIPCARLTPNIKIQTRSIFGSSVGNLVSDYDFTVQPETSTLPSFSSDSDSDSEAKTTFAQEQETITTNFPETSTKTTPAFSTSQSTQTEQPTTTTTALTTEPTTTRSSTSAPETSTSTSTTTTQAQHFTVNYGGINPHIFFRPTTQATSTTTTTANSNDIVNSAQALFLSVAS